MALVAALRRSTPTAQSSMKESVLAFLHEQEWKYEELEQDGLLQLRFSLNGGTCTSYAHVYPDDTRFAWISLLDARVAAERRVAIAELIARINSSVFLGHFDLDFETGTVSYRTTIDIEDSCLTERMVGRMANANLTTVEKFMKPIMTVAFGDADPGSALGLSL